MAPAPRDDEAPLPQTCSRRVSSAMAPVLRPSPRSLLPLRVSWAVAGGAPVDQSVPPALPPPTAPH